MGRCRQAYQEGALCSYRRLDPGQGRHFLHQGLRDVCREAYQEGVLRANDLGDRARLDETAAVHDHEVGAGLLDLGEEVAGDDDRAARRRVADHHLAHLADLGRVEAVGRFVEDEEVREAEHGLGDGEALAHALGVGADRAGEGVAEARDLQGLLQVGVLRRASGRLPVQLQVLAAGEVREEARALDERADPGEDGGARADRVAEDPDLTGVRLDQAHQHAQGGRLARAVRTQEAEHLALLDAEGQVPHRVPVRRLGVPLAQVGDLERDFGQFGGGGCRGGASAAGQQQGQRDGHAREREPPHPGREGRRRGGDAGGRRHLQVALQGDGVRRRGRR